MSYAELHPAVARGRRRIRLTLGKESEDRLPTVQSLYGIAPPPQHFFTEIAGFETSSRPCLLKDGAPSDPDVIVRTPFPNNKHALKFRFHTALPRAEQS